MSLIGQKITLTGYGTCQNRTAQAKVLRVTKLYAVLSFGPSDTKGSRYRLRDGIAAGEYLWSGYEIPPETLVQLREEAPGDKAQPHHPSVCLAKGMFGADCPLCDSSLPVPKR